MTALVDPGDASASLEGGRVEIDRRLADTNRVVGEVRRGLGEVDRQVQSVSEAARDLRNQIAARREAVTREMSRLAEAGVVARRGRDLVISDVAALRKSVETMLDIS